MLILLIDGFGISCEIALRWMSLYLTADRAKTGSGNGLVLSGSKLLPEPMLTHITLLHGITGPQWVKQSSK